MKIFTFFIFLLSLIVHSESHGAPLRESLYGVWRSEHHAADGGIYMVGYSTILPDQSFCGALLRFSDKNEVIPITYSGTWKLDGDYLEFNGTHSSRPEILPPNLIVRIKLIEVHEDYYTYELPDGTVKKEWRVKSAK